MDVSGGEAVSPFGGFGYCIQYARTVWRETVRLAPIELRQHPFADQDRDSENPLSISCCDGQRDRCAAEGDQGIDVQIVAGQPAHNWNQFGEVVAALVGRVV